MYEVSTFREGSARFGANDSGRVDPEMSYVANWEKQKHMAIELYPMDLKKQQEHMRNLK